MEGNILLAFHNVDGRYHFLYNNNTISVNEDKIEAFYSVVYNRSGSNILVLEKPEKHRGVWIDFDAYTYISNDIQKLSDLCTYLGDCISYVTKIQSFKIYILSKPQRSVEKSIDGVKYSLFKNSLHLRVTEIKLSYRARKLILDMFEAKIFEGDDECLAFKAFGKDVIKNILVDKHVMGAKCLVYGSNKDEKNICHKLSMVMKYIDGNVESCMISDSKYIIAREVSLLYNPCARLIDLEGLSDDTYDFGISEEDFRHKYTGDYDMSLLIEIIDAFPKDFSFDYVHWNKVLWMLSRLCRDYIEYMDFCTFFSMFSSEKFDERAKTIILAKWKDVKRVHDPSAIYWLLNVLKEVNYELWKTFINKTLKQKMWNFFQQMATGTFTSNQVARFVKEVHDGSVFHNPFEKKWYELYDHKLAEMEPRLYEAESMGKLIIRDKIPPALSYTLSHIMNVAQEKCYDLMNQLKEIRKVRDRDDEQEMLLGVIAYWKSIATSFIKKSESREFERALESVYDEYKNKLQFDKARDYLGVMNGILNTSTMTLCQSDDIFKEGIMITKSIAANYSEFDPSNSYHSKIKEYYNQIMPDPSKNEFLLYLLASGLIRYSNNIVVFLCNETGSSGKSTLFKWTEGLLRSTQNGGYLCVPSASWATSPSVLSGGTDEDSMTFYGARIAYIPELDGSKTVNVDRIKSMGDGPAARGIYGKQTNIDFNAAILANINKIPLFNSYDEAWWRRFFLIRMNNRFTPEHVEGKIKEDTSIKALLNEDNPDFQQWRDAWFAFLCDAVKRYYVLAVKKNLDCRSLVPINVLNDTNHIRRQFDPPFVYFEDRIHVNRTLTTTFSFGDIYNEKTQTGHFFNWIRDRKPNISVEDVFHMSCQIKARLENLGLIMIEGGNISVIHVQLID
jgi:energy-coupling factor transporter ATP-binding protein EcfA2